MPIEEAKASFAVQVKLMFAQVAHVCLTWKKPGVDSDH